MGLEESNKEVIRRFVDLLNTGSLAGLDEVWDADLLWHGAGGLGDVQGIQNFRRAMQPFFTAFPDLHSTIELLIAEGDYVAARFTTRGTHSGDFMGLPPTARKVEFGGIDVYRLKDGKIVEEWFSDDITSLMHQVGALPAPGA